MASQFLQKFKNYIFGKKETEDVISSLEDFNKLTKSYNNLLKQQIDQRKERIKQIRVMVSGISIPQSNQSSTLNIQLVDMHDTRVTRKGKGTSRKKMKWEKQQNNFENPKRGIII